MTPLYHAEAEIVIIRVCLCVCGPVSNRRSAETICPPETASLGIAYSLKIELGCLHEHQKALATGTNTSYKNQATSNVRPTCMNYDHS